MKIMILIFLGFAIFLALSFRKYGTGRKGMKLFYLRMVKDPVFSELYGRKVLLFLLLFQFVYQMVFGCQIGVVMSMILTACTFIKRLQRAIFCVITDRKPAMMALCLVTLATMFVPKLYCLSFTCATLLTAALFYPSNKVRNRNSSFCDPGEPDFIQDNYY